MSVHDTASKKQTWDSMHEQSDADPPEQTSFWNDAHFFTHIPKRIQLYIWVDRHI